MDPTKMTTLMGYDVDEETRSMIIDLFIATVVVFFIMAPSFFFKVEGPLLKRKYE
jgi:hypothetical protein